MNRKQKQKKEKEETSEWTAVLNDESTVQIRRATENDVAQLTELYEKYDKSTGEMIKWIMDGVTIKKMLEVNLKRKQLVILVAENNEKIIGFLQSNAPAGQYLVLLEKRSGKQLVSDLARKATWDITTSYTLFEHRRNGINKCLKLMTLFGINKKKFYVPITLKHKKGLVKGYKQIAEETKMKFEEKPREFNEPGNSIYLEKTQKTNRLLKKMLKDEFEIEMNTKFDINH